MESRSEKARKSKEEDRRLMIKKHFVDKQKKNTSSSKSDDKIKSGSSKDSSDSEDNKAEKRPDSPETHCPICLENMNNKSFTDSCFHTFCFTCLVEWSKVKPECPLCKQQFKSIVHNVQSDFSYDEYHLNSRTTDLFNFCGEPPRFRYSTTMTVPFLRRNLEPSWPSQDNFNSRIEAHRMRYAPHAVRMLSQSTLLSRTPCQFRNRVYTQGLWVLPTASDRFREVSPEFYRTNPACTHRLLPWLNRELGVLMRNNEAQVTFLMEMIIALIARYEITSQEFHIHVEPYLTNKTRHFVHEFYHFAASPLEMENYDRLANYSGPTGTHQRGLLDTSGAENENEITVVDDNMTAGNSSATPTSATLSASNTLTKLVIKKKSDNNWETVVSVSSVANLQNSSNGATELSDPGPSTSSSTNYISPLPDSDLDECQVLEVLKPKRERTPEIVDLSSDEEIVQTVYNVPSDSDSNHSPPRFEFSPWRDVPRLLPRNKGLPLRSGFSEWASPQSSASWSTRYPVSPDEEYTEYTPERTPTYGVCDTSSSDIEVVYYSPDKPSTSTAVVPNFGEDTGKDSSGKSLNIATELAVSDVEDSSDHETKKKLTVGNVQKLNKPEPKKKATELTKSKVQNSSKKEPKKRKSTEFTNGQNKSKKAPKKKSMELPVSSVQDLIKTEPKKKLPSAIVRPWAMATSSKPSRSKKRLSSVNHHYTDSSSGTVEHYSDSSSSSESHSRNPKKLKLRSVVAHFSFGSSDKKHDSSRLSHKKRKDKKKKSKNTKHPHGKRHRQRIYSDSDSP